MMNKIFSFILFCLCQVTVLAQEGIDGSFNPSNPPNPQVPETKYMLTTTVTPSTAGSTNYSSGEKLTEGAEVYIRAYSNTGFVFEGWYNGDTLISTTPYFYYIMPARNVKLRAEYKYDPTSPANPETAQVSYNLSLVAQPANGGSFNQSSRRVQEGELATLYAYTNTGYRFVEWQMDGQTISKEERLEYIMPGKNTTLTAVFKYDPTNPTNPGRNSWNSTTGEIIVDDFTPGYLYDAIYQKTDGNYDAVTQIMVAGRMNYNDFGVANNCQNCTYLDFSRTTGITAVPSYTYYYNSTLSTIVLPASIERLEYMAFYNCSNLIEINCYAPVPPAVDSYALSELQTGIVVHVPAASVGLYQEAEGWKDLTIQPFAEEVNALQVNLPEGSIDGRYKNMYIELLNTNSGQKLRNVINDRLEYVFGSLMKNTQWNVYLKNAQDVVLATIEGVEIKDEDVVVTFENALIPRDITLSVVTPDESDVTSLSTVQWSYANGTHLSQSPKLKGMIDGTELKYNVTLPRTLAMEYKLPEEQTYVVSEETSVLVVLKPLPTTTVSGVIRDITTEEVIEGATVSISQNVNGLYSKSQNIRTDENGAFNATIFVTEYAPELSLTCSATDYISQTFSEQMLTFEDGAYTVKPTLKSVTGATINLGFTFTYSSVDGESGDLQEWYNDYANVSYSIYNKTQGKEIAGFNAQYPQIVLLEEVAEGDVLQLTATSRTSSFVPVTAEATIDAANRASTTFNILQYGQISATYSSTRNTAVIGILYDKDGKLVSSKNYNTAEVSFAELTDGNYTLVSMAKSNLLNSIYSLSQFATAGLKKNVDFVQNTVTVRSGVISQIDNDVIPFLDESKLYYTGDNTSFTVNKTHVTAGNYLTLTGHIDFKAAYADNVNDVQLVVTVPENTSFVDNSVMVGTKVASYTTDGNTVVIPMENYSDRVRFCIVPTEGGVYSPNASVRFNLNGKEITQPIGSTSYTVKDLSISVPATVSKTTVPVSGIAIGKSLVELYDNSTLVGKTTALANGAFATTIELQNAYNLSVHDIHANVTTPTGLQMQTETKSTTYDKNAIEVKTVTMSFYNGWLRKNVEVIFDLQNKTINSSSYMFYTGTDITFVADLTNNDTTVVSEVTVRVYTDRSNWVNLPAKYNKAKDKWIAVGHFESYELPIGVKVSFYADTEKEYDSAVIEDYDNRIQRLLNPTDREKQIAAVDAAISAELEKEEVDEELIETLNDSLLTLSGFSDSQKDKIKQDYLYLINVYREGSWSEDPEADFIDYVDEYIASEYNFEEKYPDVVNPTELVNLIANGGPLPSGTMHFQGGENSPSITYVRNSQNSDLSEYLKQAGKWEVTDEDTYSSKVVLTNTATGDQIILDESGQLPDPEFSTDGIRKFANSAMRLANTYLESNEAQFFMDMFGTGVGDMETNERAKYNLYKRLSNILDRGKSVKNASARAATSLKKANISSGIGKVVNGIGSFAGGWSIGTDINEGWSNAKDWDLIIKKIQTLCEPSEVQRLTEMANDYKGRYMRRYATKTAGGVALTGIGIASASASGITVGASLLVSGASYLVGKGLDYWKTRYTADDDKRKNEIRMLINTSPKCKPYNDDSDDNDPPYPTIQPIHDPSGYVYEGVSSNRLEGVTATAYYKETTTNMYGDEEERVVLWDATDYGQENPLYTDEYGMYAWDVPQGMWQVKFEKEGYQTVYSEWLPVPPPQMDVNIAMVQAVQPKVVGGRAYKDGVEVEFDKYMMPESLTTDNIQVTKDDEKVDGTIEMLNAEKISDSDATVYASRVKFVPAEGVNLSSSTTGKITLSVNTKVKSYAGLQLQESYQQEFDVELAVSNIDVESTVNVVDGGDDRDLSIMVLPEDAAKSKTLTVKTSSTLYVNVTSGEKTMDEDGVLQVVLDEHGRATITLTGEMPGTTMLSYSVEDADVTAQTVVNVKTEELMNTESPVASRASGSALYRDTEIFLTCPTKDAVIYYTTDGSCPCDEESRLMYDENTPIIMDADELTIKALAQGEGMYDSEIVEFHYTIRETTVGMNLYEGWTWVSHNVKESQNAKEIFSDAVEVKSLTKGLIKDPVYGLVGNLDKLLPTESYKVKMDAPKNVEIYGEEFNAENDYITLKQGWNWVGFPIGQQLGLNEAFRTDPVEGDEIVGLEGYAEFRDGEWIGSLLKLIPGQGYLYSSMSENSLLYNTSIVSRAKSRFGHGLDINKAPWAANIHQYPNVMPVTANLFVNDEKADADTYSIGAFCGTECRGVGKYVNGVLFMSVHGDKSEDITFVASDNETGKIYDITESMSFSADRVGSYNAPYALHLGGEATAMTELNSQLTITPGVARDFITVEVPSESIDCITVFNMSGTPVIIQKNLSVPARINVAQLPEGTYIVSVSSSGNTYYKKVIKVN